MKINRSLLQTVIAATMVLPGYAMAQDDDDFLLDEEPVAAAPPIFDSYVEVGIGWISDSSFKFGEFTGLEDKGAVVFGDFYVLKRGPFDGDSTEYWVLRGTDLGLASRSVHLEYGHQGSFKMFLDYDQIPKFIHDDAATPYLISGGGTLFTLPANWVPGERNTGQMTNLMTSLNPLVVKHDRKTFGGGFSWIPRKGWKLSGAFDREIKEGTRTIGAIFGTSGGNPASAILPEPVDYETDTFDLKFGYANDRGAVHAGYNLSLFRNDHTSITWQNAYTGSPWVDSTSYPTGQGRLGLPPDSKAHRMSLSGHYLITKTTRATANFSYSRMTQNEQFLPFTINPDIAITSPLPRSSLEGEIKTLMANVAVTSRPTPKLDLTVRYKYENRDNNTPQDVFIVVRSDSANQGDLEGGDSRVNLPYNRKQQLFEFKAGYRLTPKTKLVVAYDFEQLKRDFQEVAKNKEHKFSAKFRARASAKASGWVGFEYATRSGSEYVHNAAFLAGHAEEHFGDHPDEEFENNPNVRKFYMADRKRTSVKGAMTFLPSDSTVIGFSGRYSRDNYDQTILGLRRAKTVSGTVDVSFNPTPKTSAYAFYTYENLQYDQNGFGSRRGTDLTDFASFAWTVDTRDKVNSAGAGVDWKAMDDRLTSSIEYAFSDTKTDFAYTAGTAQNFAPLDDLTTKLHSLNIVSEYRYTDNWAVKLRYLFQSLDTKDFALDGIAVNTISTVIALGDSSPNYNVHVIGITSVYRF